LAKKDSSLQFRGVVAMLLLLLLFVYFNFCFSSFGLAYDLTPYFYSHEVMVFWMLKERFVDDGK